MKKDLVQKTLETGEISENINNPFLEQQREQQRRLQIMKISDEYDKLIYSNMYNLIASSEIPDIRTRTERLLTHASLGYTLDTHHITDALDKIDFDIVKSITPELTSEPIEFHDDFTDEEKKYDR